MSAPEREEVCFVAFEVLGNGLQPPADTVGEGLQHIVWRSRGQYRPHVAPGPLDEFFI
jgi:hypothetical protein